MRRALRDRKSATVPNFVLCVLACLMVMLVLKIDVSLAQTYQRSRGECSPNIYGQNNTVNCPVVRHSGECPPNHFYSRTHGDCIHNQHRGGVIPCTPDDMRFVPGRGWVSNC